MSTTASGHSSHAEGSGCTASGDYSHAEGQGTKAKSNNQHVQGKYNIEDNNGDYADIVGNGTSNSRSNAYTLDWNGNAWYAGDIRTGGTGYSNATTIIGIPVLPNDASTKTYILKAVNGVLTWIEEV